MTTWQPKTELIARTVLGASAASISFTGIPATYEDLLLVVMGRTDRAALNDLLRIRFNNDSAANYYSQAISASAAAVAATEELAQTSGWVGQFAGNTATAGLPGIAHILIPAYARTVFQKIARCQGAYSAANTTTNQILRSLMTRWASTAAINRVDVLPGTGPNFLTGTVASLYGIRSA